MASEDKGGVEIQGPASVRHAGKVAGLLYLLGGLSSIPSSLLLEPPPSPLIIPVTAFAVACGLFWLAFPWQRADPRWLHVATGVATVTIALAVAAGTPRFAFYGLLMGVFVAYAFRSRAEIAGQLAFLIAALSAPLVYEPSAARETLEVIVLVIPNAIAAAVLVALIRERSENVERSYRSFAREAHGIAARIGATRRS